jgi:hypothetical protein
LWPLADGGGDPGSPLFGYISAVTGLLTAAAAFVGGLISYRAAKRIPAPSVEESHAHEDHVGELLDLLHLVSDPAVRADLERQLKGKSHKQHGSPDSA